MAVAAMIGLVEPQLFKENLVTPAVIVGAGTVIREVIYSLSFGHLGPASIGLGRSGS